MPTTDANKTFEAMNEMFTPFTASWRQLTEQALENTEKLCGAQIDSFHKYTSIGIENTRAAVAVTDLAGMQQFAQDQQDVLKKVTDQLATDAKTVAELGSTFATTVQKSSQDAVTKATKK